MRMYDVTINDNFFSRYRELVRREMIPYQWQVLNDRLDITIEKERDDASIPNEKSHAIENFRIAAGQAKGRHYGWVFQDSDVYKWLEAVAYSLREYPDKDLQELADGVVDLIAAAQSPDGYLNTYFTIEEPGRKYKCLAQSHELYCAGHFFEAAVAYYETTKSQAVLKIAVRLADHIDACFGAGEGKIQGYDGHEEVEIGLMRLYHLTGEKRYLKLSQYFIMERGQETEFFKKQRAADPGDKPLILGMEHFPLSYFQADKPVLEQTEAIGHAVRLVYLCTAMADVAMETGDEQLLAACRRLWQSIVDKRMYLTGGIGSTVKGEAFTLDYDLPEDTMYCETCASIGLIFFAWRMLHAEALGEYGDVLERVLYNTVLGAMALDGKHYFYVNPLAVVPEKSRIDPGKSHVKCVRPEWLGCACCPPNLARLLTSLEQYVYIRQKDRILVNLFMDSQAKLELADGSLWITQKTGFPWEGTIALHLDTDVKEPIRLGIRIPGWVDSFTLSLNDEQLTVQNENGFIYMERVFKQDVIIMELDMEVKRWYAHPYVESALGKTALSRGPLIYCMEEADNGRHLHLMSLRQQTDVKYQFQDDILGGVGILKAAGSSTNLSQISGTLYQKNTKAHHTKDLTLTWVPYFSWGNRGENEMRVWVREESV
ncbi:MAG: glycoside hydrolase family 127 protein [Lachnospiraceae bacterium]